MAYYRLSKEDKAKVVSDSIENQRKLIREYVSRHDNITLVDEVYDDGYTEPTTTAPVLSLLWRRLTRARLTVSS